MKMLVTRLVLALRNTKDWLVAQFAFGLLNILKLLPADGAINFADRVARWVGPKTRRHKLTLTNLRNAYPEKSEAEIESKSAVPVLRPEPEPARSASLFT